MTNSFNKLFGDICGKEEVPDQKVINSNIMIKPNINTINIIKGDNINNNTDNNIKTEIAQPINEEYNHYCLHWSKYLEHLSIFRDKYIQPSENNTVSFGNIITCFKGWYKAQVTEDKKFDKFMFNTNNHHLKRWMNENQLKIKKINNGIRIMNVDLVGDVRKYLIIE